MVNRVTVVLPQTEYSALLELCEKELRNPPDQIQHVLREKLGQRGLLQIKENNSSPSNPQKEPLK